MDIEALREYALRCKAATEDIKWEDHLCFSVGAKMFLLTSPAAVPVTACFKVSEEDFDLLCERPEFRQAPHFAKRKWIYVDDINALSSKNGSCICNVPTKASSRSSRRSCVRNLASDSRSGLPLPAVFLNSILKNDFCHCSLCNAFVISWKQ
ncbi:MAG: MmcQ/YjbR family DNA-binding protein [Chitinophagaceae bacterium]